MRPLVRFFMRHLKHFTGDIDFPPTGACALPIFYLNYDYFCRSPLLSGGDGGGGGVVIGV